MLGNGVWSPLPGSGVTLPNGNLPEIPSPGFGSSSKTDNGFSVFEGAYHYFTGHSTPVTISFSSIDPGWGLEDFLDPCSYDIGEFSIQKTKQIETLS